jgi:hypothetical protein
MAFQHPCFISYPHGQHQLMREFITGFKAALDSSLEPFVGRNAVYFDEDRLDPGYHYNEALSAAMCRSACWVIVYAPIYERRSYCRRELAGMEALEAQRRAHLGPALLPEHGFVVPVVLRGRLPDTIRRSTVSADFSSYTTAVTDISRAKRYVKKIERIAQYISELNELGPHLSDACDGFLLPPDPGPSRPVTHLALPTRLAA